MRKLSPIFSILTLLVGCAPESRWPSDVKPGVRVRMNGAGPAYEVVRADGEWLVVKTGRGEDMKVSREEVKSIQIVTP